MMIMAINYSSSSQVVELLLLGIADTMKNRRNLNIKYNDFRPVVLYPFAVLSTESSSPLVSACLEEDKEPAVLRLTLGSSLTPEETNVIREKHREFCTEHGYTLA